MQLRASPLRQPTDRQLELVRLIHNRIRTKGCPPTIREIGEELKIKSTNAVNDLVHACERKGLLAREPKKGRTLHLTSAGRRAIDVACCACRGCACDCHTALREVTTRAALQLRTFENRLHLVLGGIVVASEGTPCLDAALLDEMGMDSTRTHPWTPQLLRLVLARAGA